MATFTQIGNTMYTDRGDQSNHSRERKPIPRYLATLVNSCPKTGDGTHSWFYKTSRLLHRYCSPEEICEILTKASAGCGRPVPAKEIEDAVRNSAPGAGNSRGGSKAPTRRRRTCSPAEVKVHPALRQQVIEREPFTLADFHDISPARIEGEKPGAKWLVDLLFPGNPLICVGRTKSVFVTNYKNSLLGKLSGFSLIVPSAMSSIWGMTKGGKPSMHTASNTGVRMYLVVEFDNGSSDDHAAILRHLSEYAPLVMVLWSGGKSTHGWFNCQGASEKQQWDFFNYAVTLGADSRMWTACQFARLPQGWRAEKQARQQVYYFDPQKTWKGDQP